MNSKSKTSTDKKLIVNFIGSAEPNYGRMLWKVNVIYEGQNINSKVFKNNWNYINFEIKNWQLDNEEKSFYYIPVEGISKLISTQNFKIISLPYQGLSTARFFGNKFVKNNIIEVFDDQIVVTNLTDFSSKIKRIENEGQIESVKVIENEIIEISRFVFIDKIKTSIIHRFKIEI